MQQQILQDARPGHSRKTVPDSVARLTLFLLVLCACFASSFFQWYSHTLLPRCIGLTVVARLWIECDELIRLDSGERQTRIHPSWTYVILSRLDAGVVVALREWRHSPAISPSLYRWSPGDVTLLLSGTLNRSWYEFSLLYPTFNTTEECLVGSWKRASRLKGPRDWYERVQLGGALIIAGSVLLLMLYVVGIVCAACAVICCLTYE